MFVLFVLGWAGCGVFGFGCVVCCIVVVYVFMFVCVVLLIASWCDMCCVVL